MCNMGRPSSFKEEYEAEAYKLALLGATDKQMADFWGVTEQTVNNWKNEHPGFFESLKRGKLDADANVAKSLYHRALGYSHPEMKVFQFEGQIIEHEVIKHYPPDTGAAMAWLKNRQPKTWRDRPDDDDNGAAYEMYKAWLEIAKNSD
jgi:hypothetical protein